MSTTSLPPPISLLVEEILRVLLSTTLSVTGIKPSATTVDRSNDSNIAVSYTHLTLPTNVQV